MNVMAYPEPKSIRKVGLVGAGSVGAGWAALFLAHGLDVVAHDPSAGAEGFARDFVNKAWPALCELGLTSSSEPPHSRMRFVDSIELAVAGADLVQENVPEKMELKESVLSEIDRHTGPEVIIFSSTGGIPPSKLQAVCSKPNRLVVVHPFNPSHLIPLVEVVGGEKTDAAVIAWAMDFVRHLGKQPIQVKLEVNGHMTNRLQMALVREAVACLIDGVASPADIDAAIRYGLGPRWVLMGPLLTMHLAGGPGGMKGILNHAGQAVQEWWTPRSHPELTPEVQARLIKAAGEVSCHAPISEWIQWRDEKLVQVLKLQQSSQGDQPSVT